MLNRKKSSLVPPLLTEVAFLDVGLALAVIMEGNCLSRKACHAKFGGVVIRLNVAKRKTSIVSNLKMPWKFSVSNCHHHLAWAARGRVWSEANMFVICCKDLRKYIWQGCQWNSLQRRYHYRGWHCPFNCREWFPQVFFDTAKALEGSTIGRGLMLFFYITQDLVSEWCIEIMGGLIQLMDYKIGENDGMRL